MRDYYEETVLTDHSTELLFLRLIIRMDDRSRKDPARWREARHSDYPD